MSTVEPVLTADGSHTLFHKELNETYHSIHGAVQESRHVFIEAGLHYAQSIKKEISVLEIGLGTCLNAWLTAIEAQKLGLIISYTGIEKYPLSTELYDVLNYPDHHMLPDKQLYKHIVSCAWGELIQVTDMFNLYKWQADAKTVVLQGLYDLVYYDAFAPGKQPDMWQEAMFENIAAHMAPGAVLVSYCAQGQFRRHLQKAGLEVHKLPGPPFKKDMVRAIKK